MPRHSFERAQAEQWAFPVLLLDLDGFKHVNDVSAHGAGDEFLRIIGARLRHEFRTDDTVARLGGDEFVLVVESVREERQLAELRERLIACVTATVDADGVDVNVGCRIGASWFPRDGSDTVVMDHPHVKGEGI